MKAYGDVEGVNLATGERFRRVSGDGGSQLVPDGWERVVCLSCGREALLSSLRPGQPYTCMFCRYAHLRP